MKKEMTIKSAHCGSNLQDTNKNINKVNLRLRKNKLYKLANIIFIICAVGGLVAGVITQELHVAKVSIITCYFPLQCSLIEKDLLNGLQIYVSLLWPICIFASCLIMDRPILTLVSLRALYISRNRKRNYLMLGIMNLIIIFIFLMLVMSFMNINIGKEKINISFTTKALIQIYFGGLIFVPIMMAALVRCVLIIFTLRKHFSIRRTHNV